MATSTLTQFKSNSSRVTQRPVSSYLKKSSVGASKVVPQRRKNDPVSLFQQTQNAWKSNKFLKSGANNKEGRKLDFTAKSRLSVYLA